MSEREQFEVWWACTMPEQYRVDAMRLLKQSRNGDGKYGLIRAQDQWESWQASRRAVTTESIEATSALIANSLLGAAPEEDVREVERLINEMLGRT